MAARVFRESSFDPETMRSMNEAFAGSLASLGLKDKDDALTMIVAETLIALAQQGERDAGRLEAATLEAFRR